LTALGVQILRASPSLANGGGASALKLKIWLASLSEWDIRSLRVEKIDGEGYVGSNPTARTIYILPWSVSI
jgi:hypothetical protein